MLYNLFFNQKLLYNLLYSICYNRLDSLFYITSNVAEKCWITCYVCYNRLDYVLYYMQYNMLFKYKQALCPFILIDQLKNKSV